MNLPSHVNAAHRSLISAAHTAGRQYVLDFSANIGARPYFRYHRDYETWEGISHGPFGRTDDGEVVLMPVQFHSEYTTDDILELADGAPAVEVRLHTKTPYSDPSTYCYTDDRAGPEIVGDWPDPTCPTCQTRAWADGAGDGDVPTSLDSDGWHPDPVETKHCAECGLAVQRF